VSAEKGGKRERVCEGVHEKEKIERKRERETEYKKKR